MQLSLFAAVPHPSTQLPRRERSPFVELGEWMLGERDELPVEFHRRAPDADDAVDPDILIPVDAVVLAYMAARARGW